MGGVMICAGEASGDLHAGALTKELLKLDNSLEVYGMGGDSMRNAGGEVLFDIKKHGVMGFVEVIRKLPSLFKLRDDLSAVMDRKRPDCAVFIDYPDFNMRIAKIAHDKGIPVVYFIGPSVWAWRKGRAKDIAKVTDVVATIFPFECEIYEKANANVVFVGHPLLDIVESSLSKEEAKKLVGGKGDDEKIILLLPGSRLQEIDRLLPDMLRAAEIIQKENPDCKFILPKANTISAELLNSYIQQYPVSVNIVTGNIYDIMSLSDVAIATSGTVTLEAALCGVPSVIVYKTSPLSAFIARRFINVKSIGLPNIIADKKIMPELLQEDATPESIANEALNFLDDKNKEKIKNDLIYMKKRLGTSGAVSKVAKLVFDIVVKNRNRGFDE